MQWRIGLMTAALSISACSGSGGNGGPTAVPDIPEAAVVARIEVTPQSGVTEVGGTVHFIATAFDRDGNVLGVGVIWQSMNASVGDITQNGLALGKATGTTAIRASVGNVIGSAQLSVNDRKTKPDGSKPQP
ncbi:MAG: hypothetical protein ACREMK_10800 [Gemmatimonadota bacterium]